MRLQLNVSDLGSALGIRINGAATIELNTASYTRAFQGFDPASTSSNSGPVYQIASGFLLHVNASVEFLGLATGSGSVDVIVRNGDFEMAFDLTIDVGPFSLQATGGAGIYADGAHPGIVLRLAVSLDVNLFEIIKINASGELQLNTTDIDRAPGGVTIGREVVPARARRRDQAPRGHQAQRVVRDPGRRRATSPSAAATPRRTFNLGPGEWVVDVNASADFFGLATMGVDGWINSKGYFDIQLHGELVLGSHDFGIVGDFGFHVWLRDQDSDRSIPGQSEYRFGVCFNAEVHARLFGFSFGSVGVSGSGLRARLRRPRAGRATSRSGSTSSSSRSPRP